MGLWSSLFAGIAAAVTVPCALAQTQDLVPIVTYDQSHPLVDSSDEFPMVRVYATGDVIIYRAEGNRNPGIYELTLSEDELLAIKDLAQQAGVAQFDEAALTDASAEAVDGELRYSSDPTTTVFEFNRVQGQDSLSSGDGTTPDILQTVVLEDVSVIATATLDSEQLSPLNALHERLITLFTQAGQ